MDSKMASKSFTSLVARAASSAVVVVAPQKTWATVQDAGVGEVEEHTEPAHAAARFLGRDIDNGQQHRAQCHEGYHAIEERDRRSVGLAGVLAAIDGCAEIHVAPEVAVEDGGLGHGGHGCPPCNARRGR